MSGWEQVFWAAFIGAVVAAFGIGAALVTIDNFLSSIESEEEDVAKAELQTLSVGDAIAEDAVPRLRAMTAAARGIEVQDEQRKAAS